MKNFEFLHNITIGQYLPTGSAIHRIHPAVKMAAAGLLVTVSVIAASLSSLSFALIIALAAMWLARIPFRYALRGIRPAVPVIVLIALLQILFVSRGDPGAVVWEWRFMVITTGNFLFAAVTVLRLIVLILILSLFTFCTDIKELTHGTERLLAPLARIGFPAHELSMIITIALRFLPILSVEAENLIKAQVSRGADFGKGRMGFFKRVYRMLPLFVPLLILSLRRAESLALAMEARCYTGGKGRTRLVRFHIRGADIAALITSCVAAAAVLAIHYSRLDAVIEARLFG